MRIVHYFKRVRIEEGGVVRAVLDLCGLLARGGHDVTLLTCDGRDVPAAWKQSGEGRASALPRVVELGPPGWPGAMLSPRQVSAARQVMAGADVLHLHAVWHPSNAQLARVARRCAVPHVVSLHGMLDDWAMSGKAGKKRLFLSLFGRRVLESARAIHCTAESEKAQSARWFSNPRVSVIPLLFDLSEYAVLPGPEAGRKLIGMGADDRRATILFLSRLHPVKGIEILIEACQKLKAAGAFAERGGFRLVIAGSGENAYVESLRGLAKKAGLEDQTVFPGFVKGREKVSVFQAGDVFVLASEHENFGFVWAESLAAETPVIITQGVGPWPALKDGGVAEVVDRTPEGIANAILELSRDAQLWGDMKKKARPWVLHHLDMERLLGEYARLYQSARG